MTILRKATLTGLLLTVTVSGLTLGPRHVREGGREEATAKESGFKKKGGVLRPFLPIMGQ
jgi:hypothetical protein